MEADTLWRLDFGSLLSEAEYLGTRALEEVLEASQTRILDDLCREELGDGRRRFVRWGSRTRTLITRIGTVYPRICRVRDRLSGRTFAPLLVALGIQRKRYTPELRLCAAELATRTSYGEASQALERMGLRIPRRTIWDFLQEFAQVIEATLRRAPPPPAEEERGSCHSTDSTFVRGRRRREQHEVEVGIVQGQDHRVQLVGVRVDDRPGASLKGAEVRRLTTDDAPGLRALGAERQQLCHLHFLRHLVDLLGQEGVSLSERETLVTPLRGVLAHLRHSVDCHRRDGNGVAITVRVRETLMELGALGERLVKGGCPQSGRFVLREMRALVVFAEVGGDLWMPATSNGIERVMGMVADRCKRKWAHWGRGLRNMVLALLARKIRPRVYGVAVRRYLGARGYW